MNDVLYAKAIEIRMLYRSGKIDRAEAQSRIKPYADMYNAKVIEIAKKFNRKPKLFSFTSFMR